MHAQKIPAQSELEKIVRDYGSYRTGARVKHEWSQPKIEWETFVDNDRFRYLSSLPTRCSILVKQNCKQCDALRYSRAYYTSYPSSPSWHWELNRGNASIIYPPDYEDSLCGRKNRARALKTHPLETTENYQKKATMPKPFQIKEEFAASKSIIKGEREISENDPAQRRRNYSWCDAACQILKAENRPLGPTELTNKIMSAGLVKSRSRTPVNTVYTAIFQDIKSRGARSRFLKFGQKIGLVEWADRYLDEYVQSELKFATQTGFWQRYKFKAISNKELLSSVRTEIREIRSFIKGEPTVEPSQERLCFWVWFCYQFGLYWEGALVFRRINTLKVSPPLYQIIKRMGVICENRRE